MPERLIDKQGDVWTKGVDGLWHTPETRPFPLEHIEKKWGPLTPAPKYMVGDTVLITGGYYKREPREVQITKVGRKWFYVPSEYGKAESILFSLEDGYERTESNYAQRAWRPEDYQEYEIRREAWDRIGQAGYRIDRSGRITGLSAYERLTTDQIERIADILEEKP